jgi:hypothetical protein
MSNITNILDICGKCGKHVDIFNISQTFPLKENMEDDPTYPRDIVHICVNCAENESKPLLKNPVSKFKPY